MPTYFYLRKTITGPGSTCIYVCASPIETQVSFLKRSQIMTLESVPTRR